MSEKVPLEIGTRGTIGSLLKREIEYFTRLELERVDSCMACERSSEKGAGRRRHSWPSFTFSIFSRKGKKRRSSGGQASKFSTVEIEDQQGLDEIPRFGYLNLRAESMRYDVE